VDASVAPGWVLGGQPDGEGAQSGWNGGSTGSGGRGGPAAGDESPVPAQDGGGRDEQSEPPAGGEQPGQGGGECSVGPVHPGSWGTSLEDGELVAQDQDLDLLRPVRSGEQDHPAEELGEHQVDQP
jgi:hypothetical protein